MNDKKNKLTSKEVKTKLKIKACDLMHLRESGILKATKKGNAFMYESKDVEAYESGKGFKSENLK